MDKNTNCTLTVFTPAYNRAHTLPRTYESLKRQSCKDFIWLIIDDGSTDGTAQLVQEWQSQDNGFEIQYIYFKLVDCLEKCLIYGHIRRFAD